MISARLTTNLNRVGSGLDRVKAELVRADVEAVSGPAARERSARIVSSAYVWMAALLENFVNVTLQLAMEELNALFLQAGQCKVPILSVGAHRIFESAKSVTEYEKRWERRLEILELVNSSDILYCDVGAEPLNGKTIRAKHFDIIWKVFALTPPALPELRMRLALENLANGRNEVAHGNELPEVFGRSKTVSDTIRLTETLEEIVLFVDAKFQGYFANAEYRR